MLDIVTGGEGRRLLFCMLVQHNEGTYHECTTCEVCYLYTPLLTCIIAAQYSLEFHAYKSHVGGGTCRIVSGHGGVESYFESPVALSATVPHVAWMVSA
jgi:Pyruvate/2-oxoacid:ferredoxin oxidoreductase delta subunit